MLGLMGERTWDPSLKKWQPISVLQSVEEVPPLAKFSGRTCGTCAENKTILC